MDDLISTLQAKIENDGLTIAAAAREIGVSAGSLERHLAGEYARSDSLAKYRAWIDPSLAAGAQQLSLERPEWSPTGEFSEQDRLASISIAAPRAMERRLAVVDLFSGCGGMSLGFDQFRGGDVFETVLALDVEDAMVRAFNANKSRGYSPTCRQLDLSDLKSESEFLAYYLDHLARHRSDDSLGRDLDELRPLSLTKFKQLISAVDRRFVSRLEKIRESSDFLAGFKAVDRTTFRQTSIIGFHDALGLPQSHARGLRLGPLLWKDEESSEAVVSAADLDDLLHTDGLRKIRNSLRREMRPVWDEAVQDLRAKTALSGRGQLASSARRIQQFIDFLDQPVWDRIRKVWLEWRVDRDVLRDFAFASDSAADLLSQLYSGDRQVSVLLGGPPCQGFSRIGRGKIRSLRDHGVHVQQDSEAGDSRNRLLEAYVLCVSALKPSLFLFENVRHFQTKVSTPDGTFDATEVLAQAIEDISGDAVSYEVASRIIDCRKHLIPQTRERFFMCGVRRDAASLVESDENLADWCLSLTRRDFVPLKVALSGLPAPHSLVKGKGAGHDGGPLSRVVEVSTDVPGPDSSSDSYMRWVTQARPEGASNETEHKVDSHVIRPPRLDDRDLFALMGPGTRWMDYRCDGSETVSRLSQLLGEVQRLVDAVGADRRASDEVRQLASGDLFQDLSDISQSLNGSLSLRLLLETMTTLPGELSHHLLTDSYLSKRDGQHGDWLARMDPDRPSKTIVAHMGKDTYAYVHPSEPRTLSVREAARVQTFPDWFSLATVGFVDAFRIIGNAVPPLLSAQLAGRLAQILWAASDD